MQSTLPEEYGLLRNGGISPAAAIITLCRNNPGDASWISARQLTFASFWP
jgi:hypothetical protein